MELIEVPYQTGTLAINLANVRTVFYQPQDEQQPRARLLINFVGGGEPVTLTGEAADTAWETIQSHGRA